MLQLTYALRSDAGKIRMNNEDNYFWNGCFREDVTCHTSALSGTATDVQALAAVCDGMGGEASGEIASLIAVRNLRACTFPEIHETARESIRAANSEICQEIDHIGKRMGSTVTALYIDGGFAVPCNLGDSRIYLFRDETLYQLTTDHCKSQRLVRMGILTEEEARTHPSKHELTQHLGIYEEEMVVEPEFGDVVALQPDDTFLLCSDGLTDMVTDEEIANLMNENKTPDVQADVLLQAALDNGGRDNVTVLVIRVEKKTRRGSFSVHRSEKTPGSNDSSTSGLSPRGHLERQAEFHASTQDEA